MFGFLFLMAMSIASVNAYGTCYICGSANRKPTATNVFPQMTDYPPRSCSDWDKLGRSGGIKDAYCYPAKKFVGSACKCVASAGQEASMLDDAQDAAYQEADVLAALPDDFTFSFDKIEKPAEEPTFNPYVVGCLAFGTLFNFALLTAFCCRSRNNNRSPKL